MAEPTRYTPGFNYSGWEADHPTEPKPGAELDNDFANIQRSIDETVRALKDVRRSDGKLNNAVVTFDALNPAVKAAIAGSEFDYEVIEDLLAKDANLQDIPDKAEARENLGAAGRAANLSDLTNLEEARANLGTFSTVADVQNSHIPPVLDSIRTNGYYSPGDGGGALYVEGDEGPGAIQSGDGRWWSSPVPDLTVTVGSSGDVGSVNEALAILSRARPLYGPNNFTARVHLLSGFMLEEQVYVEDIDLSWIDITSEDAVVTINREALVEPVPILTPLRYAAFSAIRGSLPRMGVLFQMNNLGDGNRRDGITLVSGGVWVSEGAGIVDAGGMGVAGYRSSWLIADKAKFDRAKCLDDRGSEHGGTIDGACIYLAQSSRGRFYDVSCEDSGDNGIYINQNSVASARGAKVNRADRNGFYANQCSILSARDGQAENCRTGFRAIRASLGNIMNGSVNSASEFGVYADNSTIEADGSTAAGCHRAVFANRGGIINADEVDASDALENALEASRGGVIYAQDAVCTNAGVTALLATRSGKIIAERAIADSAGADTVLAFRRGEINLNQAEISGLIRVSSGGDVLISATTGSYVLSQPADFLDGRGIIRSGGTQYDLADGDHVSIHMNAVSALIAISGTGNNPSTARGTFWVRFDDAPAVVPVGVAEADDVQFTTGPLTGTTGDPGKFTISAHTDRHLYIENRSGARRRFGITVLAVGVV